METDYTYGDAFDLNYFTAPYNGLYQFYVNIKIYQDSTSSISMNSSIGFLVRDNVPKVFPPDTLAL